MSAVPVGHTAVGLAWLPPASGSLLALAAEPPDAATLLHDPGAVAHVLRFARPSPDPSEVVFTAGTLSQPGVCEAAASLLDAHPALNCGSAPRPVHDVLTIATAVASELAERHGEVSPDFAVAVTRLAALGWYAVAAVDDSACAACIEDPAHASNPEATQRRQWGLDATSIARRLVARWRMPRPVVAVVGCLKLTANDAVSLGASLPLFRVVQASVHAAETECHRIGLTNPQILPHEFACEAQAIAARLKCDAAQPSLSSSAVADASLVARLLRATARARRATGATWLAEAEATIDRMTDALAGWRTEFQDRLRVSKLESLAEFAAGASHEINNPLAVISGHAQLMLARETDPERTRQLSSIVRQTKRVHDLLQGTLQFARPPSPHPETLDLGALIDEVIASAQGDADAKHVRLTSCGVSEGTRATAMADHAHLRQAIGHVVRNAIDAAPNGGWVRIRTEVESHIVRLVIEDSGPGPTAKDAPHLFDPFFSGRSAGRGRGLGLSIAWRLVQVNGGDLRYEPGLDRTTQFVFSLPVGHGAALRTVPERKSA